jgi:biopolymer transport protein ExbD
MRRRHRKALFTPQMMLSPMIDLIFQLLVFFIVSTMYMSNTRVIPVQLPVAQQSQQVQKNSFTVTVKKDGQLYLDDNKVELNALVTDAALASKRDPNFSIIIRSDTGAEYGQVVRLLDALKGGGVTRFGLATDQGDGK